MPRRPRVRRALRPLRRPALRRRARRRRGRRGRGGQLETLRAATREAVAAARAGPLYIELIAGVRAVVCVIGCRPRAAPPAASRAAREALERAAHRGRRGAGREAVGRVRGPGGRGRRTAHDRLDGHRAVARTGERRARGAGRRPAVTHAIRHPRFPRKTSAGGHKTGTRLHRPSTRTARRLNRSKHRLATCRRRARTRRARRSARSRRDARARTRSRAKGVEVPAPGPCTQNVVLASRSAVRHRAAATGRRSACASRATSTVLRRPPRQRARFGTTVARCASAYVAVTPARPRSAQARADAAAARFRRRRRRIGARRSQQPRKWTLRRYAVVQEHREGRAEALELGVVLIPGDGGVGNNPAAPGGREASSATRNPPLLQPTPKARARPRAARRATAARAGTRRRPRPRASPRRSTAPR